MKKVSKIKPLLNVCIDYNVWLALVCAVTIMLMITAGSVLLHPYLFFLMPTILFSWMFVEYGTEELADKHHIPYEACYRLTGKYLIYPCRKKVYVSNGFVWIPVRHRARDLSRWVENKIELKQEMKQESESEKETFVV